MLNAKLVVIGGAKATEISLNLPTVMGRGRDVNLTLPHPLVSRNHCELFEQNGMLHVKDLKSLNGTYVNSQRIETSSILEPDQLLTIGNVTFRAIYSPEDASVAELTANASNVIELDEVKSSPESDSQIDPEEKDVHSRPTVRGNKKPPARSTPAASSDLLKTVHAADLNETSNVMDESESQEQPQAVPQHSILAALNDSGVTPSAAENATLSDIRTQLPDEVRPDASGVDGLVVDPSQASAEQTDFSSIELDENQADKVDSDESALGSFIRKLPR